MLALGCLQPSIWIVHARIESPEAREQAPAGRFGLTGSLFKG